MNIIILVFCIFTIITVNSAQFVDDDDGDNNENLNSFSDSDDEEDSLVARSTKFDMRPPNSHRFRKPGNSFSENSRNKMLHKISLMAMAKANSRFGHRSYKPKLNRGRGNRLHPKLIPVAHPRRVHSKPNFVKPVGRSFPVKPNRGRGNRIHKMIRH